MLIWCCLSSFFPLIILLRWTIALIRYLLLFIWIRKRAVFSMKFLVEWIKNVLVFIEHHLVNYVIFKWGRTWWNLYPLLFCIKLFFCQSFFKIVIHLSQCYSRILTHNQRFYSYLIYRWIFGLLITKCQLPLSTFAKTIGRQRMV